MRTIWLFAIGIPLILSAFVPVSTVQTAKKRYMVEVTRSTHQVLRSATFIAKDERIHFTRRELIKADLFRFARHNKAVECSYRTHLNVFGMPLSTTYDCDDRSYLAEPGIIPGSSFFLQSAAVAIL